MIKLDNVTKTYTIDGSTRVILDNVSAVFPTDRHVGVLGLNGAGKSTLLRIVSGSEPPDCGTVLRETSISWPVGATSFDGNLSGYDNVRFLARLYGIPTTHMVDFVLEHSGLGNYLYLPVKTYSSGMRARLSTISSLAIPFGCYIVDEGLATGDRRFVAKFDQLIQAVMKRSALFLVSHQIGLIQRYADMVCVLHNAKIHVFENPADGISFYNRYVLPID